jgi:hypothetical protein
MGVMASWLTGGFLPGRKRQTRSAKVAVRGPEPINGLAQPARILPATPAGNAPDSAPLRFTWARIVTQPN